MLVMQVTGERTVAYNRHLSRTLNRQLSWNSVGVRGQCERNTGIERSLAPIRKRTSRISPLVGVESRCRIRSRCRPHRRSDDVFHRHTERKWQGAPDETTQRRQTRITLRRQSRCLRHLSLVTRGAYSIGCLGCVRGLDDGRCEASRRAA